MDAKIRQLSTGNEAKNSHHLGPNQLISTLLTSDHFYLNDLIVLKQCLGQIPDTTIYFLVPDLISDLCTADSFPELWVEEFSTLLAIIEHLLNKQHFANISTWVDAIAPTTEHHLSYLPVGLSLQYSYLYQSLHSIKPSDNCILNILSTAQTLHLTHTVSFLNLVDTKLHNCR